MKASPEAKQTWVTWLCCPTYAPLGRHPAAQPCCSSVTWVALQGVAMFQANVIGVRLTPSQGLDAQEMAMFVKDRKWLGPKLGHTPGTRPLSGHPRPQAQTARSLSSAHGPNLTIHFCSLRWIFERQRKGRISPRASR